MDYLEHHKKIRGIQEMEIRRLLGYEVEDALNLAEQVFMENNAPNFTPTMVNYFETSIIHNPDFIKGYKDRTCKIYGAIIKGYTIIGVLSLNKDDKKINLLFIRNDYQNQGIASKLINKLLLDNPDIQELYVNSPLEGLRFYKSFGFEETGSRVDSGGVSFIPLKYIRIIDRRDTGDY